MKCVPREPTLDMLEAAAAVPVHQIWQAMYDAAPAQAELREEGPPAFYYDRSVPPIILPPGGPLPANHADDGVRFCPHCNPCTHDGGEKCRAPAAPAAPDGDQTSIAQDDLAAILREVGLSDAARPYSPHEVVQRELLPRLRDMVAFVKRWVTRYESGDVLFGDLLDRARRLPLPAAASADQYGLVSRLKDMRDRWINLIQSQGWGDQFDGDIDNIEEAIAALRVKADAIAALRARAERAEADAARYRFLRGEVHGPHVPLAQVVWKLNNVRDSGEWTNLSDGDSLDAAIDRARTQGGDRG